MRGLIRPSPDSGYWEFSHALSYGFARSILTPSGLIVTNLAKWLCQQLQTRLSQRDAAPSSEETQRLLEHAAAVLSMDRQHSRYWPLCDYLLFEACDRLDALGRLSHFGLVLAAVQAWFKQLPKPMADQPQWPRELSVSDRKSTRLNSSHT